MEQNDKLSCVLSFYNGKGCSTILQNQQQPLLNVSSVACQHFHIQFDLEIRSPVTHDFQKIQTNRRHCESTNYSDSHQDINNKKKENEKKKYWNLARTGLLTRTWLVRRINSFQLPRLYLMLAKWSNSVVGLFSGFRPLFNASFVYITLRKEMKTAFSLDCRNLAENAAIT